MTDEELISVGRVIGAFSSGSYDQGFEEGYRAGLEEVNKERLHLIDRGLSDFDILYEFRVWLDAKLKEKP